MTDTNLILIIDDDAASREMLVEIFCELSFMAVAVASVADATQFVRQHRREILIILSDYQLEAGTTGMDLKNALSFAPEIPFYLISGFVTREMALTGVTKGVNGFFEKPVTIERFKTELTPVLNTRKTTLKDEEELRQTFLEDSTTVLEDLEQAVLAFEHNTSDRSSYDAILRLVHTIKGTSGFLQTSVIKDFSHAYETFLIRFKGGQKPTDSDLKFILAGLDAIKDLIDQERKGVELIMPQIDFAAKSDEAQSSQVQDHVVDTKQAQTAKDQTIRVSLGVFEVLDHLSGEITIQKNMINKILNLLHKKLPLEPSINLLSGYIEEMEKHQEQLRQNLNKIRSTPFNEVVRPMHRLVRDLSKKLEKKVDLQIEGHRVDLDASAARVMADSLTHLIRNAIDHGIELPSERTSQGKSEAAKIVVRAREAQGGVIVDIEDDGRGIDPQKLKAKALSSGIRTQEQLDQLSEQDALRLILIPGFSTAKQVSDVSGRGVGMDMVHASVKSVSGELEISSRIGLGTKMSLVLPRPNASVTIEAVIAVVGGVTLAINQANIVKIHRVTPSQRSELVLLEGAAALRLASRLYELIPLKSVLKLGEVDFGKISSSTDDIFIVIVQHGSQQFALLVDEIQDNEEVVVRNLPEIVNPDRLYVGAALLADGGIGLVLSPEGIAACAFSSNTDTPKASRGENVKLVHQDAQDYGSFLCVKDGEQNFAIPLASVLRVEELAASHLTLVGDTWVFNKNDIITAVHPLVSLFTQSPPISMNSNSKPHQLVILQVRGGNTALRVDKVFDIIEVNLSTVRPALAETAGMSGYIERDSQLIAIIDLDKTLTAIDSIEQSSPPPHQEKLRAAANI